MSRQRDDARRFWRLAVPLIASNVALATLGLVDTAVVGHLDGPHYLGAVALGNVIFEFLYWGLGFLRMGTTGIVAQAFGRGDREGMRASLAQVVGLALAIGLLVVLARDPVIELGLGLLGGSAQVHAYATVYCHWAIWGAPAALALIASHGWFIGMHNARAPLVISIAFNVLNIVLDVLLVVVWHMDVRGVALASVVSEYAGLALALVMMRATLAGHPGRWSLARCLDTGGLRHLLAVNYHLLLRTLALIGAFAFFTSRSALQGDVVLAANAILIRFQTFMALALDGFANAAEALVGQAVGGRDRRAFRRAVALAGRWSLVTALAFVAVYGLAGERIVALLSDIEAVRATAARYLPWAVLLPLISVWSFLLDGVFVGATRAREMRDVMLAAVVGVYLPAWYLLQGWGNHGLWAAFTLMMAARSAAMAVVYARIERSGGFVAAVARP